MQSWPVKSFRKNPNRASRDVDGNVVLDKRGKPVMIAAKIPHDFRRTAVRRLERAGVPRSVGKKLVGHKTDSIYERYDIATEQDLRDGLEKVAKLSEETAVKVLPIDRRAKA